MSTYMTTHRSTCLPREMRVYKHAYTHVCAHACTHMQMMTEGMQCPGVQSECEYNMNALDGRLFSWIDWDFDMDNGTKAESWARTYARVVAGLPLNMTFDTQTKEFHFCFRVGAIQAPTEIFASTKYSYPHGFIVSTSSNVDASVIGDTVLVTPALGNADGRNGSDACVHITRKQPRVTQGTVVPHNSSELALSGRTLLQANP